MNKKYIVSGIVIALVLVIGAVFYFGRDNTDPIWGGLTGSPDISFNPDLSPSPTSPVPSPTPTPPPTASVKPARTPKPTTTTYPGFELKGEATCQLTGELKFLNASTLDNQDALFTYKGVDHPGRTIDWKISPNDNLSIGPNLFAHLILPDGQSLITVSLPERPISKNYELTASITYGRLVDGNVKVYTQKCLGKTTVVLP